MQHVQPMQDWSPGYTTSELDEAESRYGFRLPPDFRDLLSERHPTLGYDWRGDDERIREMLGYPLKMLSFDVENGFWWPDWGIRPNTQGERYEVIRSALAAAPTLIPLYSHRFIPELPSESGNPLFSMHGFDTIYYGSDLRNYLDREFGDVRAIPLGTISKRIPFWSDITEGFDRAYAFYAETGQPQELIANLQRQFKKDDT